MKRVCNCISPVFATVLAVLCSCSSPPPPVTEVRKSEVVGGYVVTPAESMQGQVKQQRAIAKKQEGELHQQQKEIEDLKRQQYQNERLKRYLDRTKADAPSDSQ